MMLGARGVAAEPLAAANKMSGDITRHKQCDADLDPIKTGLPPMFDEDELAGKH